MVSWIKIVKSLAVSLETINLPERFAFLIREIEEKVSLQGLSWVPWVKEDHKGNAQNHNFKTTYRWNSCAKFRKGITRVKLLHFRSTIDASRSRTRRIQFIISIFVNNVFLFQLTLKTLLWSFTFQGWVFVELFKFRWARNYFLNGVIVNFWI